MLMAARAVYSHQLNVGNNLIELFMTFLISIFLPSPVAVLYHRASQVNDVAGRPSDLDLT